MNDTPENDDYVATRPAEGARAMMSPKVKFIPMCGKDSKEVNILVSQ